MASQALYRRWRSQTFHDLIGQAHVTQTLINALRLNRVGHAYLFSGPRGTGKTSTARLLVKAVNCLADSPTDRPCNQCDICEAITQNRLLDLIEIDAASNTGVDDIRDLRDKVGFRPTQARVKFYIIDEVHMLSNSAFNALLKTLEEPPPHVIFVLATTEPEKIPATILSRCQRFDFKRISVDDVAGRLEYILQQEGLSAERTALTYIAKQGGGSMRDAISLLDQLTAYGDECITLERVQSVLGTATSQTVIDVVNTLIAKDVSGGLAIINQVVDSGVDPRQFGREIVEYLRMLLLTKLSRGAVSSLALPDEVSSVMQKQAGQIDETQLVQATKLFHDALVDMKSTQLAILHLPLELAVVETLTAVVAERPSSQTNAAPVERKVLSSHKEGKASHQAQPGVSSSKSLELNIVQSKLSQVFEMITVKNKLMGEVLRNNASLRAVHGNQIQFTVTTNWKERFEQPKPQAALNEIFSTVLGQPVVICFLPQESTHISDAEEADNLKALATAARRLAE